MKFRRTSHSRASEMHLVSELTSGDSTATDVNVSSAEIGKGSVKVNERKSDTGRKEENGLEGQAQSETKTPNGEIENEKSKESGAADSSEEEGLSPEEFRERIVDLWSRLKGRLWGVITLPKTFWIDAKYFLNRCTYPNALGNTSFDTC